MRVCPARGSEGKSSNLTEHNLVNKSADFDKAAAGDLCPLYVRMEERKEGGRKKGMKGGGRERSGWNMNLNLSIFVFYLQICSKWIISKAIFNITKLSFLILCVLECFARIYVCVPCVCWVPAEARGGHWIP